MMASTFCYKLTLAAVLMMLLYSEGTLAETTYSDSQLIIVRDLLRGLRSHRRVLVGVLLPLSSLPTNVHAEEQYLDLLNALVELSELEEELDGLALELQDSLELAATRAVLKGVLQESCNWLSLKIPDFNCMRMELKQLRVELDAHSLSKMTETAIADSVSGLDRVMIRNDLQWAKDNVRCGATNEVLEILNTTYALGFTLDGC